MLGSKLDSSFSAANIPFNKLKEDADKKDEISIVDKDSFKDTSSNVDNKKVSLLNKMVLLKNRN